MSAPRIGLLCGDLDATRDGVADYAGRLAAHLAVIGLDPLLLTTYQLADATGGGTVGTGTRTVRVDPPSTAYRTRNPSESLRVSVPSNWEEVDARDGVNVESGRQRMSELQRSGR